MTIGILITNYNTWPLTSQSISHCLKYADDQIDQFVVVDDCSTEPSFNQYPQVNLITHSQNKGLVSSLNTGLAALHTDLIMIFDSDAWPLEPYLIEVKNYFSRHPEIGIAAFQTEREDGSPAASYEAEPNAVSLLLGQQLYSRYQKRFQKNPKKMTVYTCAMIIRKQVIEDIGGFDTSYDWLELDHDICMSATRKGWKIGIVPLRAIHKGSGTPQQVSHRVIRFYKNRIKLLKKFGKYPLGYTLNLLILVRVTFEWAFLETVGRMRYNKERLNDKLFSRKELIKLLIQKEI